MIPAELQERGEEFMEIIRKGGSVIMHPTTFDELLPLAIKSEDPTLLSVFSTKIYLNNWAEKGKVIAFKPMPTSPSAWFVPEAQK